MTATELLTNTPLDCFKSYDIRGRVGEEVTEAIFWQIGSAISAVLEPRKVVVGRDCRVSGEALVDAVTGALLTAGVEVIDLGIVGTEEVYFAVDHLSADLGIVVTASHNPATDNGMKLIGVGCRPLNSKVFEEVRRATADLRGAGRVEIGGGKRRRVSLRDNYVGRLLEGVDPSYFDAAHLVTNAGNGVAGPIFDAIIDAIGSAGGSVKSSKLNHEPDGAFPNGVPNPLLASRRGETGEYVLAKQADFGIAWDGDCDRCFLFDDTGNFVDGAYFAAMLADDALLNNPGATVLHDHRVIGPMSHIAHEHGSAAHASRTGHVNMKRGMVASGAVYGGEMSGHHYFKEFMFCDSGMLPWLKILQYLRKKSAKLSEVHAEFLRSFPVSGEINYRAEDIEEVLQSVHDGLASSATATDRFDGLTLVFDRWRLNLRGSKTEPLLRLNLEAGGDRGFLEDMLSKVHRHLLDVGCERVDH